MDFRIIFTFLPIFICLVANIFSIFFTRNILLQFIPEPILYFSPVFPLKNNFTNAAIISDRSISLPVGPHLTLKDLKYISENFLNSLEKFK